MKAEILFLKDLEKQLRFLKPKDREDFTSNYRLQIFDRYKSGEKIIDIINSFETPELIAKNIYEELDISIEKQKNRELKALGITKILLGLSTILPQILAFIFLILSFGLSLTMIVGTVFCLVMFWMNFEPLQAIGGTFLSIGLLPLLAVLFFYIGLAIYNFEKIFFKISIELVTGREMELQNETTKKKSRNKNIIKIVLVSLFSAFTISGVVGCFAGDKTIGGASLSQNMLHSQEYTLDYTDKFKDSPKNEKIKILYSDFANYSWYDLVWIEDTNLSNEMKIKRDHNFKLSFSFKYRLKKDRSQNYYTLETADLPWNLKAFNISSSIFTITYNPKEVDF